MKETQHINLPVKDVVPKDTSCEKSLA